MREQSTTEIPEELKELGVQIERWRKRQPRTRAMPQELWEAAAQLSRKYGVYEVSRRLKLSYAKLQELSCEALLWTEDIGRAGYESLREAGFVQVEMKGSWEEGEESDCEVECVSAEGDRLHIRIHAKHRVDVVGMMGVFWGRETCSK